MSDKALLTVEAVNLVIHYGGILLSVFATALATWHFKGKDQTKAQLTKNTLDIRSLKHKQQSDTELLSQKMASVEAELKDMKETWKSDGGEIKKSVNTLNATIMSLAVGLGEINGKIKK